jgi:transcriptional regulator with XRE-family HTH domain
MNRGAEKLRKLLTEHGSKIKLARRVGVENYQLSHWLKGVRKPNVRERAWLEDHLKIGWRLWDVEVPLPKVRGAA